MHANFTRTDIIIYMLSSQNGDGLLAFGQRERYCQVKVDFLDQKTLEECKKVVGAK